MSRSSSDPCTTSTCLLRLSAAIREGSRAITRTCAPPATLSPSTLSPHTFLRRRFVQTGGPGRGSAVGLGRASRVRSRESRRGRPPRRSVPRARYGCGSHLGRHAFGRPQHGLADAMFDAVLGAILTDAPGFGEGDTIPPPWPCVRRFRTSRCSPLPNGHCWPNGWIASPVERVSLGRRLRAELVR